MKHLSPNARLSAVYSRLTTHNSLLTTFRFKVLALAFLAISCTATSSMAATPGFDTLVNYDTAWTFVYDGGMTTVGLKLPVDDVFFDAKTFPDGISYLTGVTADTGNWRGVFLVKLDASGKLLWKKKY